MSKKNTITVYWAPVFEPELINEEDIKSFYLKPETLMYELAKDKSKDMGQNGHFFTCPASSNYFKNTHVFKSPVSINYFYDFTDEKNPIINSVLDKQPQLQLMRPPTLKNKPVLFLKMGFICFSEETIDLTFTPPFLTEPKYTKFGTVISGSFDVSKWFRPYTLEVQMWKPKGNLVIEKNEPLFYLTTETNKSIDLIGFKLNDRLFKYMADCVSAPEWQGKNLPLSDRYEVFKKLKMDKLILSEIKNNLI